MKAPSQEENWKGGQTGYGGNFGMGPNSCWKAEVGQLFAVEVQRSHF